MASENETGGQAEQRWPPSAQHLPPQGSDESESRQQGTHEPDADRTQAFSREDLGLNRPAAPRPQMPHVAPTPPNSPYQPEPAQPSYLPSGPPGLPASERPPGYPLPAPSYPAEPHPSWPQPQPPQQPQGYVQAIYQQQPYGAAPPGVGGYGAPFGQQSYPPYPLGRPKKRRIGLWIGAAVVVVLAVLAGVAYLFKPGFLGFKKTLDHASVEQNIEKQTGYTHVVCNGGKNPTVKKGKTFTCTADGGKTITVTITNSDGSYSVPLY